MKQQDSVGRIRIDQLTIILDTREVLLDDEPIPLTTTEFLVLHFLASRPGETCTRREIIDGVRGEDYAATDRTIDVQVFSLRNKLGRVGERIQTVRGKGYRFRA